jgi:hypothetical protein
VSRERNRAEFPGLAALMDTMRELYGENVKLVHGEEAGKEIGKRPEPGATEIDLMKPCLMEADFSVMRRKR